MSVNEVICHTSVCSWFAVREGEQGESSEVRRVVRYPDAHQLFVGNVPHDVDKAELKDFFQRMSFFNGLQKSF